MRIIRVHPIRPDRSRQLGTLANPKGQPRRSNAASWPDAGTGWSCAAERCAGGRSDQGHCALLYGSRTGCPWPPYVRGRPGPRERRRLRHRL